MKKRSTRPFKAADEVVVSTAQAFRVAGSFYSAEQIVAVDPLGEGRINDTFLVRLRDGDEMAVLQRINSLVFPEPQVVIGNLFRLHGQVGFLSRGGGRKFPTPVRTVTGEEFFCDSQNGYWRVISFIDGKPLAALTTSGQAREVGRILGEFHTQVRDLDHTILVDPLPGFHDTPRYLKHYDQVCKNSVRFLEGPELRTSREIIERYRSMVPTLEAARHQGHLTTRVMHGDPKLSNILFDGEGRRAVALIDFDTVKAGLVHYDLADCLRSCCNPRGEDSGGEIHFNTSICREILTGYFEKAPDIFSRPEREYLFPALQLITFELGLRFITDYLEGDCYFQVANPDDNLHRALTQFTLVEKIRQREAVIRRIIMTSAHETGGDAEDGEPGEPSGR
ncbi:MAG: aminoglycoside phosphotransferase family protein [Proteobacteria bacterium]|nr:aminoglycoside phosphotransferase family protein [Pseudomonadota bacterium]MBU1688310.1 aminoglycoside phosphotransferase family protein [Pseudomonadota bacterium]